MRYAFKDVITGTVFLVFVKSTDREVREVLTKIKVMENLKDEDHPHLETEIDQFCGSKSYGAEKGTCLAATGMFLLEEDYDFGEDFLSKKVVVVRFRNDLHDIDKKTPSLINTIAHEAFHCMTFVFQTVGIEYDQENDVVMAYYLGFVTENIFRAISGDKNGMIEI